MDGTNRRRIYANLERPIPHQPPRPCAGHATPPDAQKLVVTSSDTIPPMSTQSTSFETEQLETSTVSSTSFSSIFATSQTSSDPTPTTSVTDTNSYATSPSHVSAAVIGVLAGLLFLILASIPVLYLWHKRRQRLRHAQREVIGRMKLVDPLASSSRSTTSRHPSFRSSFSRRWSVNMPSLFGKRRSSPSFVGAGGIEMSQTKVIHSSGPDDRGCGLPMPNLPDRAITHHWSLADPTAPSPQNLRSTASEDTDSLFSSKQSDVGESVAPVSGVYTLTLNNAKSGEEP